jgi:hypothetical protein
MIQRMKKKKRKQTKKDSEQVRKIHKSLDGIRAVDYKSVFKKRFLQAFNYVPNFQKKSINI